MNESLHPVQPPLPELLEHATFLRRLAARLVGPDGADDVVQEAYATAMARPPQGRGSVRAWLAVVVANLARRERRGARRRGEREQRAARPERQDDASVALEQLDLQRALSAYVVALPEQQRTLLFLRYFEGLTPSAIAARLGVPLKTIESRHTRALASLRRRLDERTGGDRAAWVSALAAWALPAGGSGALVGAQVAAALAAAVLAGWYLLRPAGAAGVPAAAAVVAAPAELAPTIQPRAPLAERESVGAPTPPPEHGARARLSGTVRLRADGSPLAGARVRALAGTLGIPEVTTDEQGAFAFEWSEPATIDQVEVLAGPVTSAAQRWVSETLVPGTSRELELLVSAGGTLAGHVLDEEGAPVPGALVLGWCAKRIDAFHPEPDRRTRTASDGSFTLEHLGEPFVVVAEAAGLACKTGLRGELAAGSRADGLTLVLAPARHLRGQIVDESGRPVAQARLAADGQSYESDQDQTRVLGVRRFSATRLDGRSGADGRFELGPSALASVNVALSCDGFLASSTELVDGVENRVVLARGLTVSGRVLDADGRALEGARVRLADCRGGRATTDAEGRWSIAAQEPAEGAHLVVHAPGHAIAVHEPLRILAGMAPLETRLVPELVLAGRLLDGDRQPVAGAKLLLEGEREVRYESTRFTERTTWEWAAGLHRSTTDAEGRFHFGALNPGEYSLAVVPREGPAPGLPYRLRAGQEGLELVLAEEHAGVVFRGRARSALDLRPLRSFTVTVASPREGSWMGPVHSLEGEHGAYELSGFAPGSYRLTFAADGHTPRVLPARDYPSGVAREEVVLHPAASVAFELVSSEVPSATLRFEELDGSPVPIVFGTGHIDQLRLERGVQSFAALPRVALRVTAHAPRCDELCFELDLTTPPDGPIAVRLEPAPSERLRRFQLGVFVAADPAVRGLRTLDELRVAFEAGELSWPSARIELEFLEADGTRHGHGTLEPLGGTSFVWSTTTPDEDGEPATRSATEQGPGLELELPARVTTLRLAGPGVEPTLVELEALLAAGAPVVVLAPRD